LNPKIIQHVSLVVPGVTIKSIKEFKVYKKIVIQPPDVITNMLECGNPKCITRSEKNLETVFVVTDKVNKRVKCNYCERIFNLNGLKTRIQP
jgi:aspartate carbamoyltransferase regulatory subunit